MLTKSYFAVLAVAALFLPATLATCSCNCPVIEDSVGDIFSTEPSTFIKELLIAGRGDGCCECAMQCKSTAGCTHTLCSSGANQFPGFKKPLVTCQMFTNSSVVPDEAWGQTYPHWGHQCSPCT